MKTKKIVSVYINVIHPSEANGTNHKNTGRNLAFYLSREFTSRPVTEASKMVSACLGINCDKYRLELWKEEDRTNSFDENTVRVIEYVFTLKIDAHELDPSKLYDLTCA